jgi:hypothetical protein
MLSSDKLCKLPRSPGDEAALNRLFPRDPAGSYGLGNSLKFKFAQLRIIANEHTAKELARVRGNIDWIWGRYVPQSASRHHGFSDDRLIFADDN